jgi:hypothetical protein
MSTAQEFVKMTETEEASKVEKAAFQRCLYHSKDKDFGWGEAETWEFSDGSLMIYDGRGYTATSNWR